MLTRSCQVTAEAANTKPQHVAACYHT